MCDMGACLCCCAPHEDEAHLIWVCPEWRCSAQRHRFVNKFAMHVIVRSIDFGKGRVSTRKSALGCFPIVSHWCRCVRLEEHFPLGWVPMLLVTFGQGLQWDFPQDGVPCLPYLFAYQV